MSFDPATDWTIFSDGTVICDGCESFIPVDEAQPVPMTWDRGVARDIVPLCWECVGHVDAEERGLAQYEARMEARYDRYMDQGVW